MWSTGKYIRVENLLYCSQLLQLPKVQIMGSCNPEDELYLVENFMTGSGFTVERRVYI